MAGSVNKVILVGTISKYGVSLKYAPSGTACATFGLMLMEEAPDHRQFATMAPCQVWGKRAEAVSELEPGQLCLFEGKLARTKKGEMWEMVISGFDLTPILQQVEAMP